jgi:uncharacterized protein (DUF924 family)
VIDDVLAFWFGTDPEPSPSTMQRWFRPDPAFDQEIRDRFGALHAEASAGGLASWHDTARGELALIIVLDQFSRNLYRNDPRAFAQDERVLPIAYNLLDSGRALELPPVQRMFVVMPLMHAENADAQRRCCAEAQKLVDEVGGDGIFGTQLHFAKLHADIIERFGRFPHRNATLGRESTPEELAFLAQPGSRF